jgi:hypothetical protein
MHQLPKRFDYYNELHPPGAGRPFSASVHRRPLSRGGVSGL